MCQNFGDIMVSNQAIIEEIKKAIGAHGKWKLKLLTAINHGSSEHNPSTVRVDNLCEFGKWLYGPTISDLTKQGKPYEVIKRLHAEFHRCAGSVLELALAGKKAEARELLEGEYNQRSQILVKALTKWRGELQQSRAA